MAKRDITCIPAFIWTDLLNKNFQLDPGRVSNRALPLHHWSYHKGSSMDRIMDSFSSEHGPVEGSY